MVVGVAISEPYRIRMVGCQCALSPPHSQQGTFSGTVTSSLKSSTNFSTCEKKKVDFVVRNRHHERHMQGREETQTIGRTFIFSQLLA